MGLNAWLPESNQEGIEDKDFAEAFGHTQLHVDGKFYKPDNFFGINGSYSGVWSTLTSELIEEAFLAIANDLKGKE